MTEKLGILGGSFDPVHLGHLGLARAALDARGLDRVLLMPAARQPLKCNGPHASDADRLAMLRLAVQGQPGLGVCTAELDRGGVSYLADTLRELHRVHPGADLHFIIGMDALRDLHTWRQPLELLRLCTFLIAARPGVPPPAAAELRLPDPWPRLLLANIIPCPARDISSSGLRERIAENRPIRYLVPRAVEDYIRQHRLYTKETP